MRTRTLMLTVAALAAVAPRAFAVPTATTTHGPQATSLNGSIIAGDAISGLIGTELAGDLGWHSANAGAADRLPAFTDDAGILGSGLTGLLNDNPPVLGAPVKRIQYALGSPTDIGKIQILTGNNGKDGRVFSTTAISVSTNGGGSFAPLGYFQSDPLGTVNSNQQWGSTLVSIADNGGGALVSGTTHVIFEFFAVSNTQGQYQDPFNGVNPFTGLDDNIAAAFESPLVFEVDVTAVPEPASLALGGVVIAALAAVRRRVQR